MRLSLAVIFHSKTSIVCVAFSDNLLGIVILTTINYNNQESVYNYVISNLVIKLFCDEYLLW